MRRAAILLAVLTSGALSASAWSAPEAKVRATDQPVRVMSMNQCTDQIVLELLPPERIASVTWLSRDPGTSLMAAEARRVGVNHGHAEEVIRDRPDLVIAGAYTTPALKGLLKRLDFPMIEVPFANSFEDIRKTTRQIAAAVGETARGEALIAEMDRKLAAIAGEPIDAIEVAAWDRSGFGAGEGTLQNAIFEAAGTVNLATRAPISGYGQPDAEVLLKAAPPMLVEGSPFAQAPSLGDNVEQHRIVRRFWTTQGRMLTVPQAYYVCGTPRIADAVANLRADLQQVHAKANMPLPFAQARP